MAEKRPWFSGIKHIGKPGALISLKIADFRTLKLQLQAVCNKGNKLGVCG
ncbi:MAG: hypothetical protein IJA45_05630 [Oscillospiraceae bacterium]|nr:hypothetical protein [Oscillospiraceae bacterium]MBQ3542592.1 hypothetical protein [Oscillospiraceae bacterium]